MDRKTLEMLAQRAKDNPQDPNPRLVLADAVDESGYGELAMYYRGNLKSTYPDFVSSLEYDNLQEVIRREFLGIIYPICHVNKVAVTFECEFLEKFSASPYILLANSLSCRFFKLDHVKQFSEISFPWIQTLELIGPFSSGIIKASNKEVRYLVNANLPNLECLNLVAFDFGSEEMEHLVNGNFSKLKSLNLNSAFISSDNEKTLREWASSRGIDILL